MSRDPLLGITELERVGKGARWKARTVYRKASTTPEEVAALLHAAEHNLTAAAMSGTPADDQFGLVFQAVLHLAAVVLRASGYRTRRMLDRENLFAALPTLFGSEGRILSRRLAERNKTWKGLKAGRDSVSDEEAACFADEIERFHESILEWLHSKHDDLLGAPPAATE